MASNLSTVQEERNKTIGIGRWLVINEIRTRHFLKAKHMASHLIVSLEKNHKTINIEKWLTDNEKRIRRLFGCCDMSRIDEDSKLFFLKDFESYLEICKTRYPNPDLVSFDGLGNAFLQYSVIYINDEGVLIDYSYSVLEFYFKTKLYEKYEFKAFDVLSIQF